MKTRLLSLPAFILCSALAVAQADKNDDLAKFQGDWTVESAIVDGKEVPAEIVKAFKMSFKRDDYTVTIGKEKTTGSYRLDPTKDQKTIDIMPDNGPDRGKTQPGIYQIDGDKMMIFAAQPGMKRPTNFETKDAVGYSLMILRRVK